jgi:NADH-quinone oxidoreductase subunit B
MEVTRRKLGAGEMEQFRSRQLTARQMLSGDLEGPALEQHVEESVLTTTLERAANWARGNALFPATFGLACCAMEQMGIVASRVDVARFGFETYDLFTG